MCTKFLFLTGFLLAFLVTFNPSLFLSLRNWSGTVGFPLPSLSSWPPHSPPSAPLYILHSALHGRIIVPKPEVRGRWHKELRRFA